MQQQHAPVEVLAACLDFEGLRLSPGFAGRLFRRRFRESVGVGWRGWPIGRRFRPAAAIYAEEFL